jgi:hypothetical protein
LISCYAVVDARIIRGWVGGDLTNPRLATMISDLQHVDWMLEPFLFNSPLMHPVVLEVGCTMDDESTTHIEVANVAAEWNKKWRRLAPTPTGLEKVCYPITSPPISSPPITSPSER